MKHVYTSIDIGSDTVKVVVCELFQNKLNLLATSSIKSKGIKKGLITDVYGASESVKKALNEVEQMLGIQIKKVLTSIPGYQADFVMINGEMELNREEIIDGKDVTSLLQIAMKEKTVPNKEMVTVIPIDFTLDEKKGIKDPKGMQGAHLSVRAVMVMSPKKNIYSVVSLLESVGLEVIDISLNSIGDFYSVRDKDIKNLVGAVINIGYETTSIALYNKGILVKNSMMSMGGKNIDNDLSYIYKLSNEDASRIKERFALASKNYASVNDTIEVTDKTGEIVKINQLEASEIVMSRIEEILVLARKEINILTKREVDYILITGGTSSMNNFSLIAESVLGKVAMMGDIRLVGLRNNKFATSVGNIVYFINKLKLKGKDYTMISKSDMEELSSTKKSSIISSESMLGKIFGYFFSE